MIKKSDLIKIEVLLQLQLGLIEEIHDSEKLWAKVKEFLKNLFAQFAKFRFGMKENL